MGLLYLGSSILVSGAASTALLFSIRPVIVGLTIVSLATSAPELLVSFIAAIKGSGGISIGNIIGSNVINIALVLGISALLRPVAVTKQVARIEIPYMIFISFLFWGLCLDSHIGRTDGIVLLLLLLIFLIYGILTARNETGEPEPGNRPNRSSKQILKNGVCIILGIFMLATGANFLVTEAIAIATRIGLSQTFIGISVVALGTSLPELATSAVASARGESDISMGNVVGSNLFNICMVMGVVGIFSPMTIEPSLHHFQFPFMIFISLLLGGAVYLSQEVNKKTGLVFVALFFVYIIVSYLK